MLTPGPDDSGVVAARRDAAAKHLSTLIAAEVFDRVFDAASLPLSDRPGPSGTASLAAEATLRVLSREDAMASLRELVATGGTT